MAAVLEPRTYEDERRMRRRKVKGRITKSNKKKANIRRKKLSLTRSGNVIGGALALALDEDLHAHQVLSVPLREGLKESHLLRSLFDLDGDLAARLLA